ncbi:COG1361 S-layer family protein [Oceanirhabdus seepicola]|uniref:CARDB domain-containing protein n=1 Tax=Oceanirhabdus seepicola TaxID=2828781 RepID=A0A9J6NVN4_9CLOT|nr:hypothetical protein [Oceanirhabdus seepicola]MCM1988323.1 hypothetical protein [Oceanirhabdus seepicola]
MKMKIRFSLFLGIFIILFGVNTNVFANADFNKLYKDDQAQQYYMNSELIYSGDSFYLLLLGVNDNDIVEVVSTSFDTMYATNPCSAQDLKVDSKYMLPLVYNGGKDKNITVKVLRSNGSTNDYTGYISRAVPSSDEPSNPTPQNSKIRFLVQNTSIPVFVAGMEGTLKLEIKNIGKLSGKNISVDVKMPEGFESSQISTLKNFTSVRSKGVINYESKYFVKPTTKRGVIPVEVIYTYEVNGATTTQKEIINIEVGEGKTPAKIDISDIKISSEDIIAGDSFDLSFKMKNGGSFFCYDLVVFIENDLQGFRVKDGFNEEELLLLMPSEGAKTINFPIITSKSMKEGPYKLTVNFKYKDQYGNENTETKDIVINMKEPEVNDGKLALGNIESSKLMIVEDEEFTIKAQVLNATDKDIENIYVSAIFDEKIFPLTAPRVMIESINKDSEKIIEFTFKTNKEVSGNSNLTIKLEKDGQTVSESIYPIAIEGEEKELVGGSKPIIIIDKYTIKPNKENSDEESNIDIVKAGGQFTMDIDFLNTHKDKNVENIKIMIKAIEKEGQESQDVFAPVDGSTTFYIDSISPRDTKRITTKMITIPDAKSKTYKLSVSIEYEYEEDKKITTTTVNDELGITVRQKSSFMASDLNVPQSVMLGDSIPISLQINNTGKVALSNFIVEIEGDFQTESKKQYIGNISIGDTKWFDVDITPQNEGEQKGAIIFSYEEPTGELVSTRREFKVNVENYEAPAFDEQGENSGTNMASEEILGKKNKNSMYIKIGAAIVVVIIVIIILRKRKKNKKRKEMEALELDELN